MRSCAVLRRRARNDRGHRAVRRRGDIRHRSRGACGASRAGCAVGAGVGGRGARADCSRRGYVGLCAGRRRRGEHARWRRHVQGRQYREQHGGGACTQRMLHRRALRVASARIESEQYIALYVASMRVASLRVPRCIGAHCTLHVSSVRAAPVRIARCIGACRMLHSASARGSRCIGACWRVASARVARCMLQTRSRPAAHGRAVHCVVSGRRMLPDRAKVLHVVTRYALYSARCGASAACFLLRVRRVVCDTLYADGVGRS
jgi:hypothetical protein